MIQPLESEGQASPLASKTLSRFHLDAASVTHTVSRAPQAETSKGPTFVLLDADAPSALPTVPLQTFPS